MIDAIQNKNCVTHPEATCRSFAYQLFNKGTHLNATLMYMYEGYHFWGMHLVWWIIWIVMLFWIFAIPYRLPGQRNKSETSLEILNRRLAHSEITKDEYREMKKLITQG